MESLKALALRSYSGDKKAKKFLEHINSKPELLKVNLPSHLEEAAVEALDWDDNLK